MYLREGALMDLCECQAEFDDVAQITEGTLSFSSCRQCMQ